MSLTDDLISYWKLDGNSNDAVGSNNGTDTDIDYLKLIDSYSESNSNINSNFQVYTSRPYVGQSFTTPNDGVTYILDSCKFYLANIGGLTTGSVYAVLYAHSGTYGSRGLPTGSALATSDGIAITDIAGSLGLITFTFSGANRITLSQNTHYCIEVNYTSGDGSSTYLEIGVDSSSPTASGNANYYQGSWYTPLWDFPFYVYGENDELLSGKINQGAGFNGTTSKIVGSAVNLGTNISTCIWFKTTQNSAYVPLLSGFLGATVAFNILITNTGVVLGFCRDSAGVNVSLYSGAGFNDGEWHFAVLTKSGNNLELYVDGSSVDTDSASFTGNFNSATFRIGSYNGSAEFYSGAIDEVGFWERALSSTEVGQLYNSGNGLAYPLEVGIEAEYTPIPLILNIPNIAASYLRESIASFTPISFILNIPNTIASYVYENVAAFNPISFILSIPSMTARRFDSLIRPISSISNVKMKVGIAKNIIKTTINTFKPKGK